MGVTGGNIHTILLQEENIINVPPTIGFEQWFDMSDWKKKKAEGDQAYNEWFKAKMDDVIRRLRDPEHVEKYGQITELRKKLNVQYAVGRQQKLLNEHYTGRKWLGEKIDAWLEDPNAPRRCLVTGVPGVGKSAFAVHYAHYNPKTAAALFFSADMPNYNDPCVVIQTLAYLLACLPMALGGYFTAIAQARCAASGVALVAKRAEEMSKGIVLTIMVEFYAILCLLASFLMILFLTQAWG